ncbi:MAG: 2-oxoacid:acceptor oxidoreductase subunit alpha [Candidatus Eisenbacteria sp.]|nr:2-oxoacid:acceptor oxidoreductase subunit alpha [Candidatus Eisenbacteria bacterium]
MAERKAQMLSGNEACALAAVAAGCRFFAGYPITPSSEIGEVLSYLLPRNGGRFIQMEDEIASMGAIIGASLCGVKSLTATSGPGFSLKQENIGYAAMAEIPCVIVNVMRGGPSTGVPTQPAQADFQQARWGRHGDHPIIVIAPATVTGAYELTVRAFNLSEKYRTPVVLLLDEVVGHMREKVEITAPEDLEVVNREKPGMPPEEYLPYSHSGTDLNPMPAFGDGYRYHVTGLAHDETGFPTNNTREIDLQYRRLNRKLHRYRDDILQVRKMETDDARIGIVAYGSTARTARHTVKAARSEGIPVGLLQPVTVWPFPDEEIRDFGKQVSHLIVPEMSLGQFAREVERVAGCHAEIVRVNRVDGEPITPKEIITAVREVA